MAAARSGNRPQLPLGLRLGPTPTCGCAFVRADERGSSAAAMSQAPAHPLEGIFRVEALCARLIALNAGRHDFDVADQVGVAYRDLDMGSLTEERPREGGRSLGEHAAYGTNLHALTLQDRNRELHDCAVKPVSVARLWGQRKTLLPRSASKCASALAASAYTGSLPRFEPA